MYDPSRPIVIGRPDTPTHAAALVAHHYFPDWDLLGLGAKDFTFSKGDGEIYISLQDRNGLSETLACTAWYSLNGYEDSKCFESFEVLIDWLRNGIIEAV